MKPEPAANRPVPVLDPVNDGRHRLGPGPRERESVPYVISLPEHGIGAFIYTWVNNEHKAGSAFVVFGPAVGDQPVAEFVDGVQLGENDNFDDWKVGLIHLKQDLKLRSAEFKVNAARGGIDLRFEAAHPAYAYGFHPAGCPDYAATNRLEQAGRIVGTLRLDGREYPFDTMGARDHSWGTRDWRTPQHWKWLHAQAGPDLCVHFWKIEARGRSDLRGYVWRDGKMAEVVAVEVDYEANRRYDQTAIEAIVRDNAGRTTQVSGEFFGVFPFLPSPTTTLNEGAMRCRIDGRPGVGWTEVMWDTQYLDYLRSVAA